MLKILWKSQLERENTIIIIIIITWYKENAQKQQRWTNFPFY